ncbi:hypothetical protein HAX54_025326 [Datura stramonium]|uniref:Uncharacterized protein n=1 Tax=Datura stramonium TaxID=4076 RepID=A0ABS8UZC7_DATST|nr:hypothetical protein [Datura stramonium]
MELYQTTYFNNSTAAASHMVYTGSSHPAVSPAMESVKRKRGRPRKYSTPEQAAAAKRLFSAFGPPKKRDHGSSSAAGAVGAGSSSKKFNWLRWVMLSAFGTTYHQCVYWRSMFRNLLPNSILIPLIMQCSPCLN